MARVAAVLVTHDSERWIERTLASVVNQGRKADRIIVVDDASVDSTRELVARVFGDRVQVVHSTATGDDRTDRIAHNFRQGLEAAFDCGIAVLGDHDDIWHHNRIGHQAGLLEALPDVTLLASDGRLVDEHGEPLGGTLRDAFPIPEGAVEGGPAERMRVVLRHSVATGGACAVRPTAFADVEIPPGWLHDRWWSLVAAAREQLRIDGDVVIDYRVSAGQEVGLDRGHQHRSMVGRLSAGLRELGGTAGRLSDLASLTAVATPTTRPELGRARLLRNLL